MTDQKVDVEAVIVVDLGCHLQTEVMNVRRRLLHARNHWYPILTDLHRFMIATARFSVNHDGKGCTAPDPLFWDQGSRPKVRRLHIRD